MSTPETTYAARIAYPSYVVRASNTTLKLQTYRDSTVYPPASGTFSLHDPSGNVLVNAAAVTVDGAENQVTYSLSASAIPSTLPLGRGYRETWALTFGDGTYREFRRDMSLVLYAAYPVLVGADLTAIYPELSRQLSADVTSFDSWIDEAWKRILGRLEAQGVFPECIVTSWSLREVHAELTLHLCCLGFARAQGGRWLDLAAAHKKEFEMAWSRLRFVTSSDGANADGSSMRAANKGVTFINASPRASWRGWGGI